MICPCHGCEERQVGCHAKCARYEEYRTAYEVIKKMADASRAKAKLVNDLHRENFEKRVRAHEVKIKK